MECISTRHSSARNLFMSAVVCYHYPCLDGIFAALVARETLRRLCSSLRFVPLSTSLTPCVQALSLRPNDTVYLLDFAVSVQFVEDMARSCARVIVIDHHVTGWDALRNTALPANVELHYDLEKCAATIALEYFAPKDLPQHIKHIIKLVEDSDLWRMALRETPAFRAGMYKLGWNFDARQNPAIFDDLLKLNLSRVLQHGARVHAQQSVEVSAALTYAFKVHLGGRGSPWGQCLAVEGSQFSHLRSAIGNKLAEESLRQGMRGIGVVAYPEPHGADASKIKLSLRGIQSEDTSVITVAFGGGGHRGASSCWIEYNTFLTWKA